MELPCPIQWVRKKINVSRIFDLMTGFVATGPSPLAIFTFFKPDKGQPLSLLSLELVVLDELQVPPTRHQLPDLQVVELDPVVEVP